MPYVSYPNRNWKRAIVALFDKVDVRGDNECWPWTAGRDRNGYGRVSNAWLPSQLAHRSVYILVRGEPPTDTLDHLCRNPGCCNPWHLEAVSRAENVKRGDAGNFNARKTHCPRGHPYSGENLIVRRGRRICRTCYRELDARRKREARRRSREAALVD